MPKSKSHDVHEAIPLGERCGEKCGERCGEKCGKRCGKRCGEKCGERCSERLGRVQRVSMQGQRGSKCEVKVQHMMWCACTKTTAYSMVQALL